MLATASGEKFFQKNDMSGAERLQMLYVDSRHMDKMIDGGKLPTEATAAIWITNSGLESNRAAVTFEELFEMLRHMGELADQLSTFTSHRPTKYSAACLAKSFIDEADCLSGRSCPRLLCLSKWK
jgi:hypothetical protein